VRRWRKKALPFRVVHFGRYTKKEII